MKVLCLIIDSDPPEEWKAAYDCHRHFWERCFDVCPWVHGFFIRSIPQLGHEHTISKRRFFVRGHEEWGTVLRKTQHAIRVLLHDHDYVVRTNVTSLFDFKLMRGLAMREGVYSGSLVDNTYVTGSGMILSSDVARTLLDPYNGELSFWDDIAIGQILKAKGIEPQPRPMLSYDFSKGPEQVSVGEHIHYRFRDYGDPTRSLECAAKAGVFEKVYGK